jgi:DNA-binding transcriptional LysR family regulator
MAMTTPQIPCPSRRYLRNGMLPQLAAFEAVVRLGSATRAAEALCVAQPTLSGQLRKLSESLGVRLFEHEGKRLVPTDAALVLLHTAREVFAAFERCEPVLAGLRPAAKAAAPWAHAESAGHGGHAGPSAHGAAGGRAADPAATSA